MTSQTQPTEQKHRKTPLRQGVGRDQPEAAVDMTEPQRDFLALQRAVDDPSRARPADILALQRTAGNRAVSRHIQAKLSVGPVDDSYEQEADRVAEQVLTMPARVAQPARGDRAQRQIEEEEVQTKPLAAGITPLVQRQIEEEEVQTKSLVQRAAPEEEEVQTKPDEERRAPRPARDPAGSFQASRHFESQLSATRGGGSPLPAGVRRQMEAGFGADLGEVRLHTGTRSADLNRQVSAQAFTHGKDIYLGAGQPDLASPAGKRLLAHELTHTIQQTGAPVQRQTEGAQTKPVESIQRTEGGVVQRWGLKDIKELLIGHGKKDTQPAAQGSEAMAAGGGAAGPAPWTGATPKGGSPAFGGPVIGAPQKPAPFASTYPPAIRPSTPWAKATPEAAGPAYGGPVMGQKPEKPKWAAATPMGAGPAWGGPVIGKGVKKPFAPTYPPAIRPSTPWAKATPTTTKPFGGPVIGKGDTDADYKPPKPKQRVVTEAGPPGTAPTMSPPEGLGLPGTAPAASPAEEEAAYLEKMRSGAYHRAGGFKWLSQFGRQLGQTPRTAAEVDPSWVQAGLTPGEVSAITLYTGPEYVYINPAVAESESYFLGNIKKGKYMPEGGTGGFANAATLDAQVKAGDLENAKKQWGEMMPEGKEHQKMMFKGLMKLPPEKRNVWRGVQVDKGTYDKDYAKGAKYTQGAFGSCSTKMEVSRDNFATDVPPDQRGVLITMHILTGRDIGKASAVPDEAEILLLPKTEFEVKESDPWTPPSDVRQPPLNVEMKEKEETGARGGNG